MSVLISWVGKNKTLYLVLEVKISDTRTKYETSILLWEQFQNISKETSTWIYEAMDNTAEIHSSKESTSDLIARIQV